MKSQSGISLVAVLIAVAVAGILAATLATLYENMQQVNLRNSILTDVDNFLEDIRGVLSQRELCKNALRTGGGPSLMPVGAAPNPVERVLFNNGSAPPFIIAQAGMDINQSIEIDRIEIRHADTDFDDVPNVSGGAPTAIGGVNHRVFSAQLVLNFRALPDRNFLGGKQIKPRIINLTVTAHPTTRQIEVCDATDMGTPEVTCEGPPVTPCPSATDFLGQPCAEIRYVKEVTSTNQVVCDCRVICPPDPSLIPDKPPPPIVPIRTYPPSGSNSTSSSN